MVTAVIPVQSTQTNRGRFSPPPTGSHIVIIVITIGYLFIIFLNLGANAAPHKPQVVHLSR